MPLDHRDIGFFEELEGEFSRKKEPKRPGRYDPLALKVPKELGAKRESAKKSLINTLVMSPSGNPCAGCPLEPKQKLLQGFGNLETARLVVVIEKIGDLDIINHGLKENTKVQRFLPVLLANGFKPEDLYFVALTRCSAQEDLVAVEHCAQYLRKELQRENIKSVLLIGLRPLQLLIDKKLSTIFKSRGKIFELCGKPCLVTSERAEL